MSLRAELQQILADILPAGPEDAVKGTELIRLVRLRLQTDCSDSTLRYNFSTMSADPSSPIAKVEQGQGYYRRARPGEESRLRHLAAIAPSLLDEDESHASQVDLALARWQRFRVLVRRSLSEGNARRVFQFSEDPASAQARASLWHYPDLVLAEPALRLLADEGAESSRSGFERSLTRLGLPDLHLRGLTLRVGLDHEICREQFFQALSAGAWTHLPAFHIASPISDAELAAELRRLGGEYGVEVISWGLSSAELDALPSPEMLGALTEREFEAACAPVRTTVLAAGSPRGTLPGAALAELARHSREVPTLLEWVEQL